MKKIMISVLLLALVCSAAFAAVVITPADGVVCTLGAKLSFGKVKNSLGVSEVMLFEGANCTVDGFGTVGERVGYTYSLVDNDNTEGLLVNVFTQNEIEGLGEARPYLFSTDVLLSVPRVNSELKASSLSVVTGMNHYINDVFVIGPVSQDNNRKSDFAFSTGLCFNSFGEFNPGNMPVTQLGFIYSFDKDPSKSGLIAGVGTSYDFGDGKSVGGKIEGVFHYIDGQVKVEDFVARADFSKGISGNGAIAPWVEYRYSYNAGPDVNGIFINFVPVNEWFETTFGGWFSSSLIASLHMVDGKVSFQINEAGFSRGSNVSVNFVSDDEAKVSFTTNIGYLKYVYSPVNSAEDNGVFMEVGAFLTAKPVDMTKITVNTKAVLHANYVDDQIKVNINEFTAW